MASNISTPTVQELDECLDKLINWERFALHLPGIEYEDIERIKKVIRDDVNEQKMALYNIWIDRHPDHSWNDVITALEKAKEKTMAKQIKDKYLVSACQSTQAMSPKQPQQQSTTITTSDEVNTPSQLPLQSHQEVYKVPDDVVSELKDLHNTFVPLASQTKEGIKSRVNEGEVTVESLVDYVEEQRAFPIESNMTVISNFEGLFRSIKPHYNFLNPYLLIALAIHFLTGNIVQQLQSYNDKIIKFNKTTQVSSLIETLQHYHDHLRPTTDNIMVKIKVKSGFDHRLTIWVVQMLIQTLFPVIHHSELPWYEVGVGSLVLSFIATNHMMLPLIVSCARKIELMRHLGIISVTIGNVLIRVNKDGPQAPHDDDSLTFEDCLVQAIVDDDIEVVEFLLMHTKVDVNVKKHEYSTKFINSKIFVSNYATEADILKHLANIKLTLNFTWSKICEKRPSPPYTEIMDMINRNQFLNNAALRNQGAHLPDSIRNKLTSYCNSIEKIKNVAKIKYLQEFFQSAPPFHHKVTVTLHKVWSECSFKRIEVVISFLFPLMPTEEFYWSRVKEHNNTLRVELLMTSKLAESFQFTDQSHFSAKTLGVIEIQINDSTIFRNMGSKENYTFEKGMQEAKGTRIAEFLDYVIEIPCQQMSNLNHYLSDDNNNIQTMPEDDATPLILACCISNGQIVKLLLEHGADPNIRTIELNTALFYCANSTIFEILLDYGADVEVVNRQNSTVLHRACRLETTNPRILKILLENKYPHINSKGISENTALYEACARGNIDMVIGLLQAKADPNIPNDTGITPILMASSKGHLPLVERLIEAEADPNIANKLGQTPLWMATVEGHEAVVKCLLEAKANPNIPDNGSNKTPLWMASSDGNEAMVKCLLEAKANPNIPDNNGITPLRIAHLQNHFHIASTILCHILASCMTEDTSTWIAKAKQILGSQ